MSVLYLSDLDGTLLQSSQRTSAFTNHTINQLVADGLLFSYATARSFQTAKKVTQGLNAQIPLIVYNGAFIVDNRTQELLAKNFFSSDESNRILSDLLNCGISPIVYCLDDRERFVYNHHQINQETAAFVASRSGDPRDTPTDSNADLHRKCTFYFTCIDQPERLLPLYTMYREEFSCVYSKDIYSGAQWLEIMPKAATKAQAARQLATLLGCDKIVAFGDAVNDLPLFDEADECYAVANAADVLKARANGVIASNDEDGVAHWLLEHARIE